MKKLSAVHPGEILEEEFLLPMQITQYRLAKEMHVPARRINEIVHGTRSISADTALHLAQFFATTPEFWLNLQLHYDLEVASDQKAKTIFKEVRMFTSPKILA